MLIGMGIIGTALGRPADAGVLEPVIAAEPGRLATIGWRSGSVGLTGRDVWIVFMGMTSVLLAWALTAELVTGLMGDCVPEAGATPNDRRVTRGEEPAVVVAVVGGLEGV
mmetsp:Transcript_99164/g.172036  ORF Transcript_99164/g.172036 Transcript_99164/m.172036 type:complete len:110 (-) Transcript_99164:1910-2239(-)